jgi:hypothetical protein
MLQVLASFSSIRSIYYQRIWGLVTMHKNSSYKMGRHSLNSNLAAYKIKEDNLQFDWVLQILSWRRRHWSHREGNEEINEPRQSVTKIKEFVPEWICWASKYLWMTVTRLTVQYPPWSVEAMLLDLHLYRLIGQTATFTGMSAVRRRMSSSCQLHQNIRDENCL